MAEAKSIVPASSPHRSTWGAVATVFVVLVLILTGCGSSNEADVTPTAGPPTATPQPTPSLQMGQVLFAQSIAPDGTAESPAPEIPRSATSIYAVVEVASVQPGSSFSATWTMDGTAIPELDSQATLAAGASSGQLAFQLVWEGAALWPVGTLGVTVTASTGETVSGDVQIVST